MAGVRAGGRWSPRREHRAVAESRLIDAYLQELAYSVAALPDADDIIAGVSGPPPTSLDPPDARLRSGMSRADAEAETLARYGSAALVARVFAEEAKRGAAVSTSLTRRAGAAAIAAVALIALGQTGNQLTTVGVIHASFLAMMTAGFLSFSFALRASGAATVDSARSAVLRSGGS